MAQRLEIESDDAREARLRRLLESQNAASAQTEQSKLPDLLARLEAFLPQMAAANAALDRLPDIRDARMEINSDDERDSDEDEGEESGVRQVIQMDLGLGVFEQRTRRQSGGSDESSSSESSSDSSSSDDDSDEEAPSAAQLSRQQDSDSDSDSNSDSDAPGLSLLDVILAQASTEPGRRPVRPLPQRAQRHPGISVLSSDDTDMATDPQQNTST